MAESVEVPKKQSSAPLVPGISQTVLLGILTSFNILCFTKRTLHSR